MAAPSHYTGPPIKAVFFDVDGTLLDHDKVLREDVIHAVRQLHGRGIRTAIASGRAGYFDGANGSLGTREIGQVLGISAYTWLNGGTVEIEGEGIVHCRSLDVGLLDALHATAEAEGHAIIWEGDTTFAVSRHSEEARFIFEEHLKVAAPACMPDFHRKSKVPQLILVCGKEHEDKYLATAAGHSMQCIRWHEGATDFLPIGCSKADGVAALLKHWGISKEEAMAVGDGPNDTEMLSYVGLGIAMGNSCKQLFPHAKYVTADVDKGGIRQALQYAGLLGGSELQPQLLSLRAGEQKVAAEEKEEEEEEGDDASVLAGGLAAGAAASKDAAARTLMFAVCTGAVEKSISSAAAAELVAAGQVSAASSSGGEVGE